jgi:DNA-binding winged helix-turn-helix (wHTH) protein
MRLQFGDFVLDSGTRELRREAELRHLGPTAFGLLELLLEKRPNVVAKEVIRDRLWPGTFVTGSTLATVVSELREALEDDPKAPRFLRTVHGIGYAFCGDARDTASPTPPVKASGASVALPPRLSYRLLLEGREIALLPGENVLGRVEDGVVWIDSPSVSRRHARITVADGVATLEDLGSKNGTFLRGARLSAPVQLADEAEFRLGQVSVRLRILAVDAATRTDQT